MVAVPQMQEHEDEDDECPRKRHHRTFFAVEDKRRSEVHDCIANAICNVMDVDDIERLTAEWNLTGVRYAWLGRDGLDDAPTPGCIPKRKCMSDADFDLTVE